MTDIAERFARDTGPHELPLPYGHIRALTIRQPWAALIASRSKDVENRTWRTHWTGTLLIHAGKNADRVDFRVSSGNVRGAVLAVAELTGCHIEEPGCCTSEWAERACFHWTLANIRELPNPVACTGRLGLWGPSAEVLAAVMAQTESGGVS